MTWVASYVPFQQRSSCRHYVQAESDSEGSGSIHSEGINSNPEDGENETGEDLDASMDDLDNDAGTEEPDENEEGEVLGEDEP